MCKAPAKSGSSYYNYKGTYGLPHHLSYAKIFIIVTIILGSFSVVLMALVDSKYRFTYCNIGAKGSISDGGVFGGTSFYKKLKNGELNIPPAEILPHRTNPAPYVIVADEAFPLEKHILKPFPRRNLSGGLSI